MIFNSPYILNATLFQSYSYQLAVNDGSTAVAFQMVSGSPPIGISVSDTGLISGVPVVEGSYSFTIQATTSSNVSATQRFTVVVSESEASNLALSRKVFRYTDSDITAKLKAAFAVPYVPVWETFSGSINTQQSQNVTILGENSTVTNKITAFGFKSWNGNSVLGANTEWDGLDLMKSSGAGFSNTLVSTMPTNFYTENETRIKQVWCKFDAESSTKAIGFSKFNDSSTFTAFWCAFGNTATVVINNKVVYTVALVSTDYFRIKLTNGKQVQFFKNDAVVYEDYFYPIFTSGYFIARISGVGSIINPLFYDDFTSYSNVLQTYGVFPLQPTYPYDVGFDDGSTVSMAEDRSSIVLMKPGKKTLSLNFPNRVNEYETLMAFWNKHKTAVPFIYRDVVFKTDTLVRFDGSIKTSVEREEIQSFSASLRQVSEMPLELGIGDFVNDLVLQDVKEQPQIPDVTATGYYYLIDSATGKRLVDNATGKYLVQALEQ